MLASSHRMRRGADFTLAVRRGARAGRPSLVAHLSVGEGEVLVGLVVSRAVGGAVTRNRLKRQLRALVRERLDILPEGALLVVRLNPAARGARSVELGRDLDKALDRLLSPGKFSGATRSGEGEARMPARPGEGSA